MSSQMKSLIEQHRKFAVLLFTADVSSVSVRSLVSFGPKQRSIGEAAKTQEISNFKNTVGGLKRLIGRSLSDPEVQEIEKKFLTATLVDVQGTVGAKASTA